MVAMHRRRLLRLLAISGGLAALPARRGDRVHYRWRGAALGAEARIDLWLDDRLRAERLVRLCLAEVDRLERVFSLQRQDSALSVLNRAGRLPRPPLELVSVLETARRVSELSGGAFDVTVQPLWQVWADEAGPTRRRLERAGRLVDWRAVEVGPAEVRLARNGMAVTLNGIAQGHIADRVADLLRNEGLGGVLLDLGEIAATGIPPQGGDWRIRAGLGGPVLALAEGAVATSSPAGHWLDRARRLPHLIDPMTLRPTVAASEVTVVADRAVIADALSTALAVRPEAPLAYRGLGVREILRRPMQSVPA